MDSSEQPQIPVRALIIDDEPDFRDLLRHMLSELGMEVSVARDGDEGIRIFEQKHPEFVLCDMFMPGSDGLEVLNRLGGREPRPHIACMSGKVGGETSWLEQASARLGACCFLHKPFGVTELAGLINTLFPGKLEPRRHRILVVEDDDGLRAMLSGIFEIAGYEVLEARNGLEGMVSSRCARPDLVLTDLMMPRVDGLDLLHDLAQGFPGVPVIAMSAGFSIDDKLAFNAMKRGAAALLSKPFSPEEVLTAVDKALARVRQDQ